MNKLPPVIRPYNSNIGLTGESAYLWACFIAHEADMDGDVILYDEFKTIADQLAPKPGKPTPACAVYQSLERMIEEYTQ
jgi:hypothetical protein